MSLRNIFREQRTAASLVIVFLIVAFAPSLMAQTTRTGALTGKMTDVSGGAVSNVTVTATSLNTGQVRNAITGPDGTYKFGLLPPGNYRVKFEAVGFKPVEIATITVNGIETAALDGKLEAERTEQRQIHANSAGQPTECTFQQHQGAFAGGSGLSSGANSGKRQRAGAARQAHAHVENPSAHGLDHDHPLIAAIFSSAGAGGKSTSSTGRDLHLALGAVAGDLVRHHRLLRHPGAPDTRNRNRGPIRVHKALAWIHGPGMILTPILGAMAFDQKSKGERVHGIASAHLPVAIVTAGAFGAALLSVSFKF